MSTPQSLDGAQHRDGGQYRAEREAAGSVSGYLQGLAALVRGRASVSAVFGEPVAVPGGTIIPVARVRFLVGGGLGRGNDVGEGGGGGAGAMADPIGYLEIKDGTATYRPIYRPLSELLRPAAIVLALAAARRVRTRASRRAR